MSLSRYPAYKPSNVEWLGEVPVHWEVKAARFGYSIQLGKMLQPEQGNESEFEVPYLKSQHVQWEAIRIDELPTMWASATEEIKYGIKDGDLLVCEGGDVGRAGIIINPPPSTIIQNALHRVRSYQENNLRFLMYVLEHAATQGWFEILCNRSTIAHFTGEKFGALRLPMPSPEEQQTIADFLDAQTAKIDTLLTKKRQFIAKLKEKRSALIARTVTRGLLPDAAKTAGLELHPAMKDSGVEWVGDIPVHWQTPPLYARYSIELGKMLNESRITGDYLVSYLRNIDVQWDAINFDDLPEMDITEAEYSRYTITKDDLLVCEGGEVGRTAIVGQLDGVVGYQKALHRMRALSNEVPRFMYYTLYWAATTGVFNAGGMSTIAHLTGEQLRKYRFPRPPLEEQQAIAAYLDRETTRIDQLTAKVEAAIARLTEYRQALITAAVTGKIDVRDNARIKEAAI